MPKLGEFPCFEIEMGMLKMMEFWKTKNIKQGECRCLVKMKLFDERKQKSTEESSMIKHSKHSRCSNSGEQQ